MQFSIEQANKKKRCTNITLWRYLRLLGQDVRHIYKMATWLQSINGGVYWKVRVFFLNQITSIVSKKKFIRQLNVNMSSKCIIKKLKSNNTFIKQNVKVPVVYYLLFCTSNLRGALRHRQWHLLEKTQLPQASSQVSSKTFAKFSLKCFPYLNTYYNFRQKCLKA